ncbi:hypothetical protein K490DRAFT_50152 [Saccharata proteae CBS 121410]|uniref:pH-response regulator protein palC n=1 Tax=Saccharata proteae CBS 121410 TaxID=1314787 RepID=A0A9P4LRY9_9PEZI|nr:hypothetical protein K490DRAFT_50152 [Saccharata proteae CBS 121410]
MPFPFTLPTTSTLTFTSTYTSPTHPSLPLAATTARSQLRLALKHHKRLPFSSQPSHLPAILDALTAYLPYLSALDAGLSGTAIGTTSATKEDVDVVLVQELSTEWRAVLSASTVPGRPGGPRVRMEGLEAEVGFVLSTLGMVYSLLARAALHSLYGAAGVTPEQRTKAIQTAMKHFLAAHACHAYLATRASASTPAVPDICTPVQSALAELTLAEATLIAVLKDDPYPAAVAEERSATSREWMVGQPEIPKVRAHLFARLCLAAAEHAGRGIALLGSGSVGGRGVDEGLVKYLRDLRGTARGKACRFLGIDAELAGRTGEGIAWLRGAAKEMGFVETGKEAKSGLSRFKMDWKERREDRRIEKGGDWGGDAGRFEEGRIVELLERKWVKMNDTVGVQPIPPSPPLLASMPSGREYHVPQPFKMPTLDEDELARLRAPPDPSDAALGDEGEDSADEGEGEVVGAFPGTGRDYGGGYY